MQSVSHFFQALQPAIIFLKTHSIVRYSLIGGILSLLGVFLFLYFSQQQKPDQPVPDIAAIAGDDINATQLDLAKAYLELGQKNLAKNILRKTIKQGGKSHKIRARQLLKSL